MASDSLRAELLAVPGVASAEVAVGEGSNPAGVKVRLTPDADARRVGAEVQRVLAEHGMRSRFSEAAAGPATEVPPVPDVAPPTEPEIPPAPAEAPPVPVAAGGTEDVAVEVTPDVPVVPTAVAMTTEAPSDVSMAGLRAVAVEETAAGLGVIVSLADGRSASRSLANDQDDLDPAVVAAVAEAMGSAVEAVATEWMELDGGSVVTVVLRHPDGRLSAGAGVVRLGRAFAVGVATAAALQA